MTGSGFSEIHRSASCWRDSWPEFGRPVASRRSASASVGLRCAPQPRDVFAPGGHLASDGLAAPARDHPFFLKAFGLPADVGNALRVQVTQSLSTILPITPAGIGSEQALIVHVLSGQASRAALLSFSVGMKFALSVSSLVLGSVAIWLMLRTLRWRRLLSKGRSSANEAGV